MRIERPSDIPKRCNNFTPDFCFYTGQRETGELDFRDEPKMEVVPATREEILAVMTIPKFKTYEEYKEVEESGKFAVVNECFLSNHAIKPAFIRMLILFPEFTTTLVAEMSLPENKNKYTKFEEHLYVAYQLMSRLVDETDLYVLRDNDEVDGRYLCR